MYNVIEIQNPIMIIICPTYRYEIRLNQAIIRKLSRQRVKKKAGMEPGTSKRL